MFTALLTALVTTFLGILAPLGLSWLVDLLTGLL